MDGDAREAIAFYEKALDAKVMRVQTFGEAPPDRDEPVPDEVRDRVMYALLKVGETDLITGGVAVIVPDHRKQRPGRAAPASGRAVEHPDGVSSAGTCMAKDVYCQADDRLTGADRLVHRGAPDPGNRNMEIAGEIGRPGARQADKAAEAQARRTLLGGNQGLPGYGLRRGNRA